MLRFKGMSTTYEKANPEIQEPSFEISDSALKLILEAKEQESSSDELGLFVEIIGQSATTFQYDLYFERLKDAKDSDIVKEFSGLKVIIPERSAMNLNGARLDTENTDGQPELVLINPNKPRVPGLPDDLTLETDFAKKVKDVLDNEVNPAIRAHGGRADLVGVKDFDVYLELSGGCQGCGMAQVTLSQGIEHALREALPELENVYDVTDHSSGVNPYY